MNTLKTNHRSKTMVLVALLSLLFLSTSAIPFTLRRGPAFEKNVCINAMSEFGAISRTGSETKDSKI